MWQALRHPGLVPVPSSQIMNRWLENPASAKQSRVGTWNAERTALAAEVLQRSGWLRLRLRGESMLPTLWPGDEVDIALCSPEEIRRGEVLLVFWGNRFFLHRVWRVSRNGDVVTRGDAMPGPDPAVPAQAIVGKIARATRGCRTFRPWRRCSAIRRALGILFCHSSLARRFALKLHSWRVKKLAECQQSSERSAPYLFHPTSDLYARESQ